MKAWLIATFLLLGCIAPQPPPTQTQGATLTPTLTPTPAQTDTTATPTATQTQIATSTPTPIPTPSHEQSPSVFVSTAPQQDTPFIISNPLDLSQVRAISKFRSCAGHDYSSANVNGEVETERSMKHYVAPVDSLIGSVGQVKAFAPFAGRIISIEQEEMPRGKQVWISDGSGSGWIFVFFHIDLVQGLGEGSEVRAGELVGYAYLGADSHDFDIALKKFEGVSVPFVGEIPFGPGRQILDSPFSHMSTDVLAQYQQRGVTPENVIVSKEERDGSPCVFGGEKPEDWVYLS